MIRPTRVLEYIREQFPTVKFGVEIETGIDTDDHIWTVYYDENGYRVEEWEDWVEEEREYSDMLYDLDDVICSIDDIYHDGSCGMEIPTKVFSDVMEFRNKLKLMDNIFYRYGYDYKEMLSPEHGAGGHFNISWENFEYLDDEEFIQMNKTMYPYIGVLVFLFGHDLTSERNEDYRYMSADVNEDGSNIFKKYHWFHLKNYAIELRFPDSPAYINRSVVGYITYIGMILTAAAGKTYPTSNFSMKDYEIAYKLYNRVIRGSTITKTYEIVIDVLVDLLIVFLDEYIQFLRDEFGWDLEGAIRWCYQNFEGEMPDDVFEYFFPTF